jgi:hypothetical protein
MNTLTANDIYLKLTNNIINTLNKFKSNEIKENVLNENLLLNASSMCKFLDGKEYIQDNLDVVLPSKLQQNIESKVKIQENDMLQRQESFNDEASFLKDMKNVDNHNMSIDMNESLFSTSIMMTDNNTSKFLEESISYSRAELSTIYNYRDMNNTTLLENTFQNFYNKIGLNEQHKSSSNNSLSFDDKLTNISGSSNLKQQIETIYKEINGEMKDKEIKQYLVESNAL